MATVTFADLHAIGYCNAGAREWFKAHGLDYATFIKQGLPEAVISATHDAMALKVVAQAQKREGGQHGA